MRTSQWPTVRQKQNGSAAEATVADDDEFENEKIIQSPSLLDEARRYMKVDLRRRIASELLNEPKVERSREQISD